jgi:NAD(P)-dependent dehydrogenase (short-subunit alcohol dehydrogenase family)
MQRTILITGSTDGIGLETAKMLRSLGHNVLLHGRNRNKLTGVEKLLAAMESDGSVSGYVADLSVMSDVEKLAAVVTAEHPKLDVLINNAGVYTAEQTLTEQGLDIRFVVNTIAPYLLTQRLIAVLGLDSRVINLSSAAQSPVKLEEMVKPSGLLDFDAYAQSKLAITMWTRHMAKTLKDGPSIIAVNPGSMLGSKMVKEAFGVAGASLEIGAKVLTHASLDAGFAESSGQYFDNDIGQFASPHSDALDEQKCAAVVAQIELIL